MKANYAFGRLQLIRLLEFGLLPALAAVSALAVLPIVSRQAGQAGWASALSGEALGTLAGVAMAWGWHNAGPAWVSVAKEDELRGRIYRDSLVARLCIASVVVPLLIAVSWSVSSPGHEALTVMMALQGALIAMSFSWFAVGLGEPRSITLLDAVPRLAVAFLAAILISLTGVLELYPIAGMVVTVTGTAIYTRRTLRRYPARWPSRAEIPHLLRKTGHVVTSDVALGVYAAVPLPTVTATSPASDAAAFASADKIVKLSQFIPITLANALQAWIADVPGPASRARARAALIVHALVGLTGWVLVAALGPELSALVFGSGVGFGHELAVILGASVFLFSVRTSMVRHILLPDARSAIVMRAGLIGSVLGSGGVLLGAQTMGTSGAALGFSLSELIMVLVLLPQSVRLLQARS